METIKVNMTPCEDIKTIHASQNDNEARQWGFELHNNGELIDTSEITEQLFFKSYKGGTEQILPENGSEPTTSPFKGDIKYLQGLLSDQEFTYRQSPTEEDGLAKITDIKGNTLVWNQLVQNGNFADSSRWTSVASATINSVSNNTINVTTSATVQSGISNANTTMVQNHKYLLVGTVKTTGQTYISISGVGSVLFNTNNFVTKSNIFTWTSASGSWACMIRNWDANSATFEAKNIMLFDLIAMGLDSLTNAEILQWFADYFSLPYYDYNQGSLLSFNGNGIKTVGKNQLDPSDAVGLIGTVAYSNDTYTITYSSSGDRYVGMNFYRRGIPLDKLLPKKYTLSFDISGISTTWAIGLRNATNNSFLNSAVVSVNSDGHYSLTIDLETNNQTEYYLSFVRTGNQTSALTVLVSNVMLEIGNTETSYQPYTSSTLSLPISTYFSNGMKSAGNVYDEISENKVVTRVGTVTLNGTEIWHAPDSSGNCWMDFYDMKISTDYTQTMTATVTVAKNRVSMVANSVTGYNSGTLNYMYFRTPDATQSVANVKAYLQANPVTICYVLATPTETSFTTASLVTENAEIPLSNEDGTLIGKCTEELSAEPGFHDAKIKLADEDGECYSNKLQLHIERKPL